MLTLLHSKPCFKSIQLFAESLELLATDNVLSRSLVKRLSANSEDKACVLSLLQLHALLCSSETEKSPGRHEGGGATRGVRGERTLDTTLRALLLKPIEPLSVVPTDSTGPASICVTRSSAEERTPDEHTTSARSTDAASIVSRPLPQKHSLKLSEPIVAVVQSVFGSDFVPVRAREKTPAVLPKPCCRLALALNLADLILQ